MQHTEFGFQVIKKFLENIAPYGHPDFAPKLIGKGINVMISPLPRNKRAKNPRQVEGEEESQEGEGPESHSEKNHQSNAVKIERKSKREEAQQSGDQKPGFANNPFEQIDVGNGSRA